jgi:Winged helix DNA-binding domain
VDVLQRRVAQPAEEDGSLERRLPRPESVGGRIAAMRLHDLRESADPRDALVSGVPDESEAAARPKDAVDLREGLVAPEPVERLPDRDSVHRATGEGYRLRRARQGPHPRKRTLQDGAHLVNGLDCQDLRTRADEERGEFARPGGDVEDDPARAQVQVPGEERDHLRRISRPSLLVGLGREGETLGRGLVDVRGHGSECDHGGVDVHELRARRAASQLLSGPRGAGATDVVRRLLAVQAQNLPSARLAIRARTQGLAAADVDGLLTDGSLVVGWLMRGTLHLVLAEDYWWLHGLTAPTRLATNRRRLGQEGVSPDGAERAVAIVAGALEDEGPLTRTELAARLGAEGIRAEGQATHHLLMLAALRGVAVLGPPRDAGQAFVLAGDWLGTSKTVDRDAALAELGRRYLPGHEPATPADLARWSGLPLRDARLPDLSLPLSPHSDPPPRLLPAFDPYLLGWKDRSFAVRAEHAHRVHPGGGVLRRVATVGGEAAGTWALRGGQVEIEPFLPLRPGDEAALAAEAEDVVRFQAR